MQNKCKIIEKTAVLIAVEHTKTGSLFAIGTLGVNRQHKR